VRGAAWNTAWRLEANENGGLPPRQKNQFGSCSRKL